MRQRSDLPGVGGKLDQRHARPKSTTKSPSSRSSSQMHSLLSKARAQAKRDTVSKRVPAIVVSGTRAGLAAASGHGTGLRLKGPSKRAYVEVAQKHKERRHA